MFLRVDENDQVDPLELNLELTSSIPKYDAVIVSDYNKGFVSLECIEYIGRNAKVSFIDSKKKLPLDILKLYTFVKMNEQEYKSYNGILDKSLDNVIVTLGSKGARYKDKVINSLKPIETSDVSGAGDTFLAAFVDWYLETNSILSAIAHANEKATAVVSKKGVAIS
jgi:bifunctional ADP-heptose synthase (sugar kinase/adenylyltransferase)